MEGPPYPFVEFALRVGGTEFTDAVLPDTGFDGELIVPRSLGRELAGQRFRDTLVTAGGEVYNVDAWPGVLMLEDRLFRVRVKVFGDQFIIGRAVLDKVEICFEFGRRVRLRFE
jgi:predicted aspartyl protease